MTQAEGLIVALLVIIAMNTLYGVRKHMHPVVWYVGAAVIVAIAVGALFIAGK